MCGKAVIGSSRVDISMQQGLFPRLNVLCVHFNSLMCIYLRILWLTCDVYK